jgi:hypothetical protein
VQAGGRQRAMRGRVSLGATGRMPKKILARGGAISEPSGQTPWRADRGFNYDPAQEVL